MELISLEKKNNFKKYLELPIDNLNLLDYQLEMINQNSSIRAANIEKIIFNETLLLNYDVSGLINLEEYFISNRTSKSKLLKILIDIGEIIAKSNEYFLNSDNFLLNEKQIFLNLDDLKVTMIYIPVEESINDDINKSFRELLKKIVIDLAVLDDMDLKDNFMQIILNQSKMQEITIQKFLKTLQDIKEENFINKREEVSKEQIRDNNSNTIQKSTPKGFISQTEVNVNKLNIENKNIKNSTENYNQLDKNTNNIQRIIEKPIESRSNSNGTRANISKGLSPIKNKSNQKKEIEEETVIKEIYKPSRKIGAVIIQFIFIPIIALALVIDGMDLTKKIVGAVMLVALDILVLRVLLDKDKKIKVKVSKGKANTSSNKGKKVKKEKGSKRKKKKSNEEDLIREEVLNPSVNLSKKEIISQLAYDTEVLDNDTPYLLLSNGGVAEKIYINKDIYKIGRLSSQCDYTLNSKAVGKVHAQIIKNNSRYYIEDLDSKNGSFINSVKIESNQLVELSVDDNITLANINMTFKID